MYDQQVHVRIRSVGSACTRAEEDDLLRVDGRNDGLNHSINNGICNGRQSHSTSSLPQFYAVPAEHWLVGATIALQPRYELVSTLDECRDTAILAATLVGRTLEVRLISWYRANSGHRKSSTSGQDRRRTLVNWRRFCEAYRQAWACPAHGRIGPLKMRGLPAEELPREAVRG